MPSPAPRSGAPQLLLSTAKRVPDRHPIPSGVVRAELVVVVDQVNVRFGSNEEVANGIEADPSAEVS